MFNNINTFIDTVQGAKSQFLNTFVTDKGIRQSLQDFVDAQTSFTKTAAKSLQDVVTQSAEQALKFDVTKTKFAK